MEIICFRKQNCRSIIQKIFQTHQFLLIIWDLLYSLLTNCWKVLYTFLFAIVLVLSFLGISVHSIFCRQVLVHIAVALRHPFSFGTKCSNELFFDVFRRLNLIVR